MLLYLQDNDELFNTELICSVVTAEIPDKNWYPELYILVKQHIVQVRSRTTYLGARLKNELSRRQVEERPISNAIFVSQILYLSALRDFKIRLL